MKQLTWKEYNHHKMGTVTKEAWVDPDSIAGIHDLGTGYSEIVFKKGGYITVGMSPSAVAKSIGAS